ncbi:MAG: L-histidine N(alpha)-methyltransferase [Cyclobacteriaceae bacterium]
MNQFKLDIIDLFNRKRGGHVDHWLYRDALRGQVSGSQLWHQFLKASKSYYVLKNEIELISRLASTQDSNFQAIDTIIDFGVGNDLAVRKKIIPLVHGLKNVKAYIGIDISKSFLDKADAVINGETSLETYTIQGDFYSALPPFPGNHRLGLMLGSTITNQNMREGAEFPEDKILSKLSHLRKLLHEGDKMLITFYSNTDRASVYDAYTNVYWSRHIEGLMYDVSKIAIGDFKADGWQHQKVWGIKAPVIHQCLEATVNQSFNIGDESFEVKRGERFVAVNNFKFPVSLFQSLCKKSGFSLGNIYADPLSYMHIQELNP